MMDEPRQVSGHYGMCVEPGHPRDCPKCSGRHEVDLVAHEGVVVTGFHPMTWAGACVSCGQPDYAPGCESSKRIAPLDFRERCHRLRERGLDERLVKAVWQSGSAEMLRKMEAFAPEQVDAINAAVRG